ncbi:hypothetical protein FACS1894147_10860 [Spirochaetia bacterium]|nr:hypothetical protein FACS1894147_10860 [Spirochaetia bacterium]
MITVYIILGLIALCAVCVVIISIQAKSVKKYKEQNDLLAGAVNQAAGELKRLKVYFEKNKLVEETANAQRQELDNTADDGLASRANNLFGMRDKPDSGSNNGT